MRINAARVAAAAAGSAGVAAIVVARAGQGWAEWLFTTVCLTVLALVVGVTAAEWRAGSRQRRWASELDRTPPDEVARRAVAEERVRLAEDIGAELQRSLLAVQQQVETLDRADPLPGLQRIHREARRGATELRRQLGLLRPGDPAAEEAPSTPPPAAVPTRGDILVAGGVTAIALAESLLYPHQNGEPTSLLAVVLTCAAAACLLGVRAAPGAAAATVGVVLLLATALGSGVVSGFWVVATLGGLCWALAARGRSRYDLVAALLLVVGVVVEFTTLDAENLGITLVTLVAAATGGGVVRGFRARGSAAAEAAGRREQQLSEAAHTALGAERSAYAREIHDEVSHAVGLIAVQAAAAEVSWPSDPEATWRAVDVIDQTARGTSADLGRLRPGPGHRPRTVEDLGALVDRIRQTGIDVEVHDVERLEDLDLDADLDVDLDTVYRVVQEALTNLVRHSGAAHAEIAVDPGVDQVTITISDDGGGATGSERGYGLIGLEERVAYAGGTFSTWSEPGAGFTVAVSLPRLTVGHDEAPQVAG
jgi:signal transduction histidine kinase